MANKKLSKISSNVKKESLEKNEIKASFLFENPIWLWILPILGMLLYLNTIHHGFVLDDYSAIKDNYIVKKGFEAIHTIWKTEYRYGFWNVKGELYRPIILTMFAVEWAFSPDNPSLHHGINIILYGISIYVILLLLKLIFNHTQKALIIIVVLLFTVHPIHTEVVANIKSRDEIMALLFSCISLIFFIKHFDTKKIFFLILSLFSYTIAMFSKESSITLLPIFGLSIYFFRNEKIKNIIVKNIILIFPIIAYLVARKMVLGGAYAHSNPTVMENAVMMASNTSERWATIWMLNWRYFFILFKPFPLSSDWGYSATNIVQFSDFRAILGILSWFFITFLAVYNFNKNKIISYCAMAFIATFSLYSNIPFIMSWTFGERFLYVPSLFFCIALAYFILKIKNKNIIIVLLASISIIFSILTFQRNKAWANSNTLYQTDIKTCPDAVLLNYHYSIEIVKNALEKNDPQLLNEANDSAIILLKRAIHNYPLYHDAYGQLGLSYFRKNLYEEALNYYIKSLKYNPNNATVWSNMGTCYFNTGKTEEAEKAYKKAVLLNPRLVDAHRNLGAVFAMKKDYNNALNQFNEALLYDPNCAICYFYIGKVHEDKGEPEKAKPFLEKAYTLEPKLKK